MATTTVILETAFEKYERGPSIGNGGSGTVYRATDSAGKDVAIKVLDAARATATRRKRFQNELTFCMTATHQNIVKVTGYGLTPSGEPFFVMPLYPATLRGAMQQRKTHDQTLRLFSAVLDGVEAAHLLGASHRDLKPENILVDGAGTPVVADFGIAHFEQDELYTAVETKDNERLANFIYAAPEQRSRGASVDPRADIYALGLMLNEMYTGEVPYGTNPKRIAAMAPACAYLDDLVDSMTRQAPVERPQTIGKVKELLVAKGNEFVALQELDAARKKVVNITEVQDPVVADPIRIVRTDYDNGMLIFQFNHTVPSEWLRLFPQVAGRFTSSVQPGMLKISGNTGLIPALEQREVETKGLVLEWMDRTNQAYAQHVQQEALRKEREARGRLAQEIKAAEYRARMLKELNK